MSTSSGSSECVFEVPCADSARSMAPRLVDDISGHVMWVPEAQRAFYHVALAHGANHLVTLVSQSMELLRRAGSDDPASVLRPLLTAALENSLSYGDAALTGPIVRGDLRTVTAHLRTLAQAPRDTLQSYVTLARATANRAVADGRLEPRLCGGSDRDAQRRARRDRRLTWRSRPPGRRWLLP